MKLELHNCDERYTVEQSMLNLFPGELPVYEPIQPGDDAWAVVSLDDSVRGAAESGTIRCSVRLCFHGQESGAERTAAVSGTDYSREGQRRRLLGQAFYLAALGLLPAPPPWGMLSGVRPDKLVTRAMFDGASEEDARRLLEQDCFVTPPRAAMAVETGRTAFRVLNRLGPRDVCVYVGIPFCPTRCAYCSFVSQSVEKSFSQVPPYVDALTDELRAGGETARRLGLRVRAFYMGGGTPTTLRPGQLDQILSAFQDAFDLSDCEEYTVEAGRPDTITAEKLAVLRAHGVDRISVNPQSLEDRVLKAIGRRHTAADVERAMGLAAGFPRVNMDLIAGLPEDTPEGFARTLEKCLAWKPDNLTVHTLALKKGSRILTGGMAVPAAADVAAMLDHASPALRGAGYAPYYLYRQKYMSGSFENVGWCGPGTECLYNVCIMSELCTILSFGAGGSTKLADYRTNRIRRLFHPKYPAEYLERRSGGWPWLADVADFYGNP